MVDPEKYPDTNVLKNLRNITNQRSLEEAESVVCALRLTELYNKPGKIGKEEDFDLLPHLKVIHKHLFQDIYSWAGEVRSYPMKIGIDIFTPSDEIENWARKITFEIERDEYLYNQKREFVVEKVARYLGLMGLLHPFPEGNVRTQRVVLWQLTQNAGYTLKWEKVHSWENKATAQNVHRNNDYTGMELMIDRILTPIEQVI